MTDTKDRAVCDAATQGGWLHCPDPPMRSHVVNEDAIAVAMRCRHVDATFIAHFDPPRVRGMLDEVERLTSALVVAEDRPCERHIARQRQLETDLAEARAIAERWHDRWGQHASQEQHECDAVTMAQWGDG